MSRSRSDLEFDECTDGDDSPIDRDIDSDTDEYLKPAQHPKDALSRYRNERQKYLTHEEHRSRGRPPIPQGPPSMESLSTIPPNDDGNISSSGHSRNRTFESPISPNVKEVYKELQEISEKLKQESRMMYERDEILKDKERALSAAQDAMELTIEQEVCRRIGNKQQATVIEIRKLEDTFKEKAKENKRLKENFDTLKTVNETLRKEVDTLTEQHDKLEKQHVSLQARLTNLQRKHEKGDGKEKEVTSNLSRRGPTPAASGLKANAKSTGRTKVTVSTQEVLGILLDWVSECNLKAAFDDRFQKPTTSKNSNEKNEALLLSNQDKSCKILPFLAELLKELPATHVRIITPCLQFIYFSVLHLDNVQSHQKTSLTSTLRRLGEELYRPRPVRCTESESVEAKCRDGDKSKEQPVFFRSNDAHVRFISCLIIIKTDNQVDHLAHVYDVLRNDLKSDTGKGLFLQYHATPVMLPHLRPSNKALCGSALDIYLQMAMESIYLRGFLDTCSREHWFQIVSLLWRMPGAEPKLLEKLSIILQKLSKIKVNKRYFEVFGITTSCQEYLRTYNNESAFLTLNLKSILFNLNVTK